jgi:hypothetical protein
MKKNTSLYYLLILGFALAAPLLLQKLSPKKAAHAAASAPAATQQPQQQQHGASPAVIEPARAPLPPAAPIGPERTFTIETPEYKARISSLNAGVKSFLLKDAQFQT